MWVDEPTVGKRHRLAVGIFQVLDRRIRRDIEVGVVRAGHGGADHTDGRALGVSAHDAERAEPDAEIGTARDHRLQRLARPLGVEDVEYDAVLPEDAGVLRELRDRLVPNALGTDRELERVLRPGKRMVREQSADGDEAHYYGVQHSVVSRLTTWSIFDPIRETT
jgi:hypothetical protein